MRRLYQAMIQMPGEAISRHAHVEASDLEEAKRLFEERFKGAAIWALTSDYEANRPR